MIRKIARPMLASVYIADGVDTLVNTDEHVPASKSAIKKIKAVLPPNVSGYLPNDPELVARALGATKVGAGSLLALGKAPRLAAGTLAIASIPTILGRYAFWEADSDEEKTSRRNGFLTNVALLGGLTITSMDTAGKPGLAWRAQKAGKDVNKKVQAALPTQSESEKAMQQAGDWISDKSSQATDAVSSYVDDHKDEWKAAAGTAAATAGSWLGQAKDAGQQAIDTVQKEGPKWVDTAKEEGARLFGEAEKTGREWIDAAEKETRGLRKRAVKNADKAQTRAEKALDKAQDKTGRAANRAQKRADKLQKNADKAIKKAKKKVEK